MAARLNKLHQDDIRQKFYVYELFDADGVVQYVGKGSGRRLGVQKRKFSLDGRIVKTFEKECAAYAFEVERITVVSPALNRCKGGNGCTVAKKRHVKTTFELLYDRIGSRALAARMMLAFGPSEMKTAAIRSVAGGWIPTKQVESAA